jgi:hypothetical protein
MNVSVGQPWKERARDSMHCTVVSRGMEAFSEFRTVGSRVSWPLLETVEGSQLLELRVGVSVVGLGG